MSVGGGEILAITGPSGGGKSTLLHCLAGIMVPDSGEITYRDQRVDLMSESQRSLLRRTEFGVLFQFGQLVSELTAAENIALPLLLAGTTRKAAHAAAMTWLDRLGIADTADQRPGQVSGGQQQRISLGRALITHPTVLFADEPTGSLDTLAGEQVMKHITYFAREEGTTVILVTHDMRIAAYADRELVLRDGQVDPSCLGLDRPALGRTNAEEVVGR